MEKNSDDRAVTRIGIISSWSLSILTIITWGLAMIATPPSGPFCPANCMDYPYSNLLAYFPRDYYWMHVAMLQVCVFMIFIIANHFLSPEEKKIYSFISVVFAVMAAIILISDYYIQAAVIPISVMKNQMEGIALLTQYNGHGIFIALEELGYILMSLAFLFLAPVYLFKNKLEKAMRVIFTFPFVANVLIFIVIFLQYGMDRDYRFEVAVITTNFLAAIVIGILSGLYLFKKKRENTKTG